MSEYKLKNILKQKNIRFHVERTTNDGAFELHSHDFCELVFVVSGTGIHRVGDAEYPIQKGDLFVIKGQEMHGFACLDRLQLFNMMFNLYDLHTEDCRDLSGFWVLFVQQAGDFLSQLHLTGSDYEQVLRWCECLLTEYNRQMPGYAAICHSLLIQLIVFLARKYQNAALTERPLDFRLAHSILFMQTNFRAKITVEQLAELEGFSRRHYTRLFSQTYGVSPAQFLNEIRLGHAKTLLEAGGWKITDIAAQCGFQDGNYFSKYFKQKCGCAPSDWH